MNLTQPALFVLSALLVACGGTNDAERICQAAHDCGTIAEAEVDPCAGVIEHVDADRALSECADCLETTSCGEIDDGACRATCDPAFDALAAYQAEQWLQTRLEDLTDAEVDVVCDDFLWSLGGPGAVDFCDDGSSVTLGTMNECRAAMREVRCDNTVGDLETCLDAAGGDACWLYRAEECAFLTGCSL